MAVDVSGFVNKPPEFGGLYKLSETLEKRKLQDQQLAQQREGKQLATTKFLTDYLDPKDRLTGTNYDPEIVKQLQETLQEGAALSAKGASTADIMMALGPKVNKINEYSTKAKLINQQIKQSTDRLKGYGGYNLGALEDEAKKMAFYDADGKLKDITTVDPNTDWVTKATQDRPELVTTGAGLDEFVKKTPSATYSRNAQTAYAGRTRNVKYEATHPFWEDLATDDKGQIATDAVGNPIGLDIVGTTMVGDDGKPMINPETNKPYRVMDKGNFNAIMQHNPDVADYIRGQVNSHFKKAGADKIPVEGSPQWEMMARSILRDELKTRSKSSFKTIDQQKETGAAVKVEIGQSPSMLKATERYYDATRKDDDGSGGKIPKTITYADAIAGIMNNDPDFSGGEIVNVDGKKMVDVTSYIPDLKYNNDQVYKKIYRDPDNNSLIVEKQNGEKQSVPEGKIFQFINKHTGYNNLNPAKARETMEKSGFDGSFSKAKPNEYKSKIQEAEQKEQQEKSEKLQSFQSSGKVDEVKDFEGQKTKDGTIKKISKTNAFNMVNDYYVEFSNGSEKKFKNKEDLAKYLKGEGAAAKEKTSPAPAKSSGGDWKSRAKKI